jgi:hypothetical protein
MNGEKKQIPTLCRKREGWGTRFARRGGEVGFMGILARDQDGPSISLMS